MTSRLLALALVALLVCSAALTPAGVRGQQAPSLGAPSPEETAPPPAPTSDSSSDGLETWQQALIFGAGIVLLGGIAFAIVGDARERVGLRSRGRTRPASDGAGEGTPHRHKQRTKERARAKGKAARQQRRRNR